MGKAVCDCEKCKKKETCERYIEGRKLRGGNDSYLTHPEEDCIDHNYGEYVEYIGELSARETTVVNKYHSLPYDVYIARGSKWGNPFSHLDSAIAEYKVETREEAIVEYRKWLMEQPELLADLYELKGKVLCCFCKPAACHGDVLVELANKL